MKLRKQDGEEGQKPGLLHVFIPSCFPVEKKPLCGSHRLQLWKIFKQENMKLRKQDGEEGQKPSLLHVFILSCVPVEKNL